MKSKLRHFRYQLTHVPRTLQLIWHAARGWTLLWLALLTTLALLPVISLHLTRALVDSLAVALNRGAEWPLVRPILQLALAMGGVLLLTQILQATLEWVRAMQSELISDHLSGLVHEKSVAADMAFYELADYHDRLHRARAELRSRPIVLLESLGGLLQSILSLLAIGAVIVSYGLWLVLALLISALPGFYVVLRANRQLHQWWSQTTTERRWIDYYDMVLVNDYVAGEIRIFNLGSYFQQRYRQLRRSLREQQINLLKKQGLARLSANTMAVLISGVTVGWMVWRALLGFATLGDLALFYQAITRGQSLLSSLFRHIGQIYESTLFLGNLFEFIDLTPQVADPAQPATAPVQLQDGVRLRRVTFRYPGSETPVFQDFDFYIPAGKIVAIVGSNGAGKTTLVKLLCRFYDPEAGSVELDGVDIRTLSLRSLRRMFTVMFQFPVQYIATAAENIALGDHLANPTPEEIETAARLAGAHDAIARLPNGYNTLLGKLFPDGAELSGGERQRLSLARAYLRRAQIMILDEPTSFMDSWSEVDWFDRLRELANGRTTLIITHRLTIAKNADIIYLMDKGQIIESGNHTELLAKNGRYAQSWFQQIADKPVDSSYIEENGATKVVSTAHCLAV